MIDLGEEFEAIPAKKDKPTPAERTERSPLEGFREAILDQLGFAPKHIIGDGKIHRFATSISGRDCAGWYKFHDDEFPAGAFGDWRTGEKYKWCAREVHKLSVAERRRLEEVKSERERKEAEERAEAIDGAQKRWLDAVPAKADHPYLARKGIQAHGARQENDRLLIPIKVKGEICSVQSITADGSKKYHYGAPVAGGYYAIDGDGEKIVICEGFATGATIHEATGLPVLVAFTASNVEAVARMVRDDLPCAAIIIAADDDHKTEMDRGFNPGLRTAHKAADAAGAVVAVPPFDRGTDGDDPSDWNDFAALRGIEHMKNEFLRVLEGVSERTNAESNNQSPVNYS
jgi:putative DNA primase/helicase